MIVATALGSCLACQGRWLPALMIPCGPRDLTPQPNAGGHGSWSQRFGCTLLPLLWLLGLALKQSEEGKMAGMTEENREKGRRGA